MKITMIGTSGSGKTVFSAGIYSTFMRKPFEGFNIFPHGDNYGQQVLDSHSFAENYKVLARYKWPKGTDGFFPYYLDLFYNGDIVTSLDWIDYRGGFLDEHTIDVNKSMELYANIAISNAVILFADAEKLSKYTNPEQAAFESGAEAVMQVIRGYSLKYPNKKLTFLIALTKCDAVEEEYKGVDYGYHKLLDFGEKVFSPIYDIFHREKSWRGGIIAISGVGEGKVDADNNIIGFPEPINIEHVMAYSISSVLRFERSDLIRDVIELQRGEREIMDRYRGIIGALKLAFKTKVQKDYSDKEALEKYRNELENESNQLRKIEVPLERLADIAMKKVRIIT